MVFFVSRIMIMSNWHGGKGSKRRPEDKKKIDDNWDKIFKKKKDKKKK